MIRSMIAASVLCVGVILLNTGTAGAITIDWVTVGDPGNDAYRGEYGAVAQAYRIMKYEVTNALWAEFLNAVAATNTYSLYDSRMGSDARGGITQVGSSGAYSYTVRPNMGDKPVNFVDWFSAARFANWMHNGQGSGATETGAYTLFAGPAPARNPEALFYIPSEDQWYKAAYYKAGSTNAGYWKYATQSDTAPTAVTAGPTGIGSSGSTGNFANFNFAADWNTLNGNLTTVGTNGGPSAYGTFDMGGNVLEWTDGPRINGRDLVLRGGDAYSSASGISASDSTPTYPTPGNVSHGFRLASPVPVPEPSTWVMGLAGITCGAWQMFRRRAR